MTDETGTTDYVYDPYTSQLTEVTYPDSRSLTFTYDPNGNRKEMTGPFGTTTYYTYNNRQQLTSVRTVKNQALEMYTARYTYFDNGLIKESKHAKGMITDYGYAGYALTNLTHKDSGSNVTNQYAYKYDNKNIRLLTQNGQTQQFSTVLSS